MFDLLKPRIINLDRWKCEKLPQAQEENEVLKVPEEQKGDIILYIYWQKICIIIEQLYWKILIRFILFRP